MPWSLKRTVRELLVPWSSAITTFSIIPPSDNIHQGTKNTKFLIKCQSIPETIFGCNDLSLKTEQSDNEQVIHFVIAPNLSKQLTIERIVSYAPE